VDGRRDILLVLFMIFLHCHRHKRFVSELARGTIVYMSSFVVSDNHTDATDVLKAGEVIS